MTQSIPSRSVGSFVVESYGTADFIVATIFQSPNVFIFLGRRGSISRLTTITSRCGPSFTPQRRVTHTVVRRRIGAGNFEPVPNSPPIDISIFTSVNGIPVDRLGTVQVRERFSHHASAVDHRYSIDFSHSNSSTAGEHYFLAFQTPNGFRDFQN